MGKSLVKETVRSKKFSLKGLPFKVGDKAVYPAHGVGEIKSVESREISGSNQTFYVLQILDSGMKIMVPTTNVNSVGLREVIAESEVDGVYEVMRQRDITLDHQTWNRRYRDYMDKIKTGSVYEIAEVLRDLSLLKREKELSFGERKMLDTAKTLLVKELAISEGRQERKIYEDIEEIFRAV
ncbi:MAG: CarD family transcriptional regulator [Deltaproteobacteria bacterium]|nr:CarD family transcriptional regulator [Deltaproteobacteria bacterium]